MNKILSPTIDRKIVDHLVRTYAFKSDLKIKWVRPEKIPSHKPAKSGDLSPKPQIDKTQYLLQFRNSKELETANDYVKRLFTLEFHPDKHTKKAFLYDTIERVKSHEYDENSIEVKLARWTGCIRAWQEVMEKFPKNTKVKVYLKELIEQRRKRLKLLRRDDYKKFEWLLEELDIVYKPVSTDQVTRKKSLVKLTDKYCDDFKQQKLDILRSKFENEQPAFLEEKIRTLEFIRDEQKECGAEVTVDQSEIDQARKQLEELKMKRMDVEDN